MSLIDRPIPVQTDRDGRPVALDGGVYEIDYRRPAGRWFLYRVYD